MTRILRLALVFALALGSASFATKGSSPSSSLESASDPDCESFCFEQYFECARGCVACDQCSCELALCRAGCGVPYTGC